MTNRPAAARARWLWLLIWPAMVVAVAAADVKVTPLVTRDGKVAASFSAPGAFTTEIRDVLKTGLEVEFAYTIELKRPSFWIDHTLGSTTAMAKAKFDNLTGTYTLTKLQDDRVTSADRTDREDQMRAWLTQADRVPIDTREPLEQDGEYYVQVKLHVSPRQHVSFWPFSRDEGSGRGEFTFVR